MCSKCHNNFHGESMMTNLKSNRNVRLRQIVQLKGGKNFYIQKFIRSTVIKQVEKYESKQLFGKLFIYFAHNDEFLKQ